MIFRRYGSPGNGDDAINEIINLDNDSMDLESEDEWTKFMENDNTLPNIDTHNDTRFVQLGHVDTSPESARCVDGVATRGSSPAFPKIA